MAKSEEEITRLHDANTALKDKQSELNRELLAAKEKLLSTENMLSNMTSGHEEIIAREKKASEDRATQMRETDEKHAEAVRDLEGMIKANDVRAKYEMTQGIAYRISYLPLILIHHPINTNTDTYSTIHFNPASNLQNST